MSYEIEHNVPVPPAAPGKKGAYPFASMDVGDSFVVEKARAKAAHNYARTWGKRHNKAFTVRTLQDGSLRIWRTE